ncbi:MAG: hypothetical protein OXU77_21200 [Gammaproteobacteria bacterium]|nr:hypothetical protein [Gammaproteobacteria bacterium]
MASVFRLLVDATTEDRSDATPPWVRSTVELFSSFDDVEVTLHSHGDDADFTVPAHAVTTRDPSLAQNDYPELESLADEIVELDGTGRFDAVLVLSYGLALDLANTASMCGRLLVWAPCLPDWSSAEAVRRDVISVVSAAGCVLCDSEDLRSRIEYAIPESRTLTLYWPPEPPESDGRRLIRRLRPEPPEVLRGRKLRVVVAGYDLKFINGILRKLALLDECELRVDEWATLQTPRGKPNVALKNWADVVICEWCGANAVWYSRHKRRGQRLIVRLHRFEITTALPYAVELDAVDQLITVCPKYQQVVREELAGLPTERVVMIPNYADASTFERGKLPGAHLHMGMIGMIPKLKRLDLALDILEEVRRRDDRFCLFVKSRFPSEVDWLWKLPDERRYFRSVLRRVQSSPSLEGAVTFDPFGWDVANWLRKIGTVLSTSDAEAFQVAPLEGMMSGSVGVVLPWDGADGLYPEVSLAPDVRHAAERILELADLDVWASRSRAAKKGVEHYDLDRVFPSWAGILVEDRDPDAWP